MLQCATLQLHSHWHAGTALCSTSPCRPCLSALPLVTCAPARSRPSWKPGNGTIPIGCAVPSLSCATHCRRPFVLSGCDCILRFGQPALATGQPRVRLRHSPGHEHEGRPGCRLMGSCSTAHPSHEHGLRVGTSSSFGFRCLHLSREPSRGEPY